MGVADRVQVDFVPHPLTPDGCEAYAQYDAIAVFIGTKVSRTTLEALPRLRLVLTMSTGYDHIDIDACRERGVVVCNVPHYGENTVAEHTFALILSLSRKLHAAYFQSLRGEYQYALCADLTCMERHWAWWVLAASACTSSALRAASA